MVYYLGIYAALAALLLFVLKAIYNVFFHPLSDIPGPILATSSRWWLFVHEMKHDAHKTIMELHKRHGPLVRISPDEISVNDIGGFQEIYSQTSKFPKAEYFYHAFTDQDENLFTMHDRAHHLQDKRLMSAAFSRAAILQREDKIYAYAQQLMDRFTTLAQHKREFPLLSAFHCMTLDLISYFVFGETTGALSLEDFQSPIVNDILFANVAIPFFQQFPTVRELLRWATYYKLKAIPNPIAKIGMAAEKGLENMRTPNSADWTMFKAIITNASKASLRLTDEHLVSEGILMLVAGTDTTAVSLSTTTHQLLQRPDLYEKLRREVMTVMPTKTSRPSFSDLDALPFLDACIKEGLRLSSPVRGRLPRAVPSEGWTFNGRFFKPGTIVSSSPLYLLHDTNVFPSPDVFDPNRWLNLDEKNSEKLSYFRPFSRGTRQCIGQNMSLIEQKITLAMFVLHFDPDTVFKKNIEFAEAGTNALPDTTLYVRLKCYLEDKE